MTFHFRRQKSIHIFLIAFHNKYSLAIFYSSGKCCVPPTGEIWVTVTLKRKKCKAYCLRITYYKIKELILGIFLSPSAHCTQFEENRLHNIQFQSKKKFHRIGSPLYKYSQFVHSQFVRWKIKSFRIRYRNIKQNS